MEEFKIGRYPHNFGGDLLRDVVVKSNSNNRQIEEFIKSVESSINNIFITLEVITNYWPIDNEDALELTPIIVIPYGVIQRNLTQDEYDVINKSVSKHKVIYVGLMYGKHASLAVKTEKNDNGVIKLKYWDSNTSITTISINSDLTVSTESTNLVDVDNVQNTLVSDSTIYPLSAKQGKILDEKKVDKVEGKELSSNDFTDSNKATVTAIANELQGGKKLSSNDYTDEEKVLVGTIINKVDKVAGKGLSTNDFTTELKNKLDSLSSGTDYENELNNKVDKVEGKELSSNDFITVYKNMLDNVEDTVNNSLRPATETELGGVKLSSDFSFDIEGEIYLNRVYGIEWDTTVSDPSCTRIGDMSLHKSLPIQSKMKACLLNDNGTVNYYLNPNDWSKKLDGTASKLDGTDGQVMIEIPEHYRKFEEEGNIRRCYLSEGKVTGFHKVDKVYVGAFEAACDRTNSKLASVCNETEQYRGGNNQADWDLLSKSQLGKCATAMTRATMRTRARARGSNKWNIMDYNTSKTIFWLYFVEYANRNCQLPVNSELDSNGYRQGGLGSGATTLSSADWSAYDSYYPLLKCGASNSLASGSGEVLVTLPEDYKADTTVNLACNRYRGIENPFGHIWMNIDGIIYDIKSDSDGGTSEMYITKDYTKFDETLVGFTKVGDVPRSEGYVTKLIFGEEGEFSPSARGGSSTTYWCDYWYTSITSTSLRTLLLGGSCNRGANSGFSYCYSGYRVSNSNPYVGGRLCYLTY